MKKKEKLYNFETSTSLIFYSYNFILMKKLILISFIILANCLIFAQESENTHPLDEKLYLCLENSTTNAEMLSCLEIARKDWEAELKFVYDRLIRILPNNQSEALRIAQIQWMRYRDAELGFSNMAYASRLLPEYKLYAAEKRLQMLKDRCKELEVFYWDFVNE